MSLSRVISVLSLVVVSGSFALAAPKKADKKKAPPAPVAPAKDDAAAAGSAAGSAVDMPEDAPPSDMNGTDENPDAPHDVSNTTPTVVAPPVAKHAAGYPIEEVMRPITLPANLSEVSFDVRAPVDPLDMTMLLHARYGITSRVQLGVSYIVGGVYDDPATAGTGKTFHPGKALGVDVTVLLQNWLAVRIGVPVYVDPVAVGLQIGAPIKFAFADNKIALGGFDDLLNIKLSKFAPSLMYAGENAAYAAGQTNNTETPNGHLRFSVFGEYQMSPQLAIIARVGVDSILGSTASSGAGTATTNATATYLRGGIQYSVRKYFDLGASLGFDDLAHSGSFAPEGYIALRI